MRWRSIFRSPVSTGVVKWARAAAVDIEADIDLLVLVARSPSRRQGWMRLRKRPLFSSSRCWSATARLQRWLGERLAEVEVRWHSPVWPTLGGLEMSPVGRDAADEPAVLGEERRRRRRRDRAARPPGYRRTRRWRRAVRCWRARRPCAAAGSSSAAGCRAVRRGRAAALGDRTEYCGPVRPSNFWCLRQKREVEQPPASRSDAG